MSKYELDDDLVRRFVKDGLTEEGIGLLANALNVQIPLPVPTKIGAVVRTTEPDYVYVRWALDDITETPWVDSNDDEHRSSQNIGRITEILSEGVDL